MTVDDHVHVVVIQRSAFRHDHHVQLARGGDELLSLDVETILRRLFWQEKLLRLDVMTPRFACTCSRERVANMIRGLGREESDSIVAEQGEIEVACDFCGQQYRFDAVDAARLFAAPGDQPPVSSGVQ